jgi:nitroimidazol reductase NimA-like FMN-containing flavoprotein (pyridoxamine 5'-phosphate oxidase superfamily)
MVIREMGSDECRRLLQQASFGRLACARDNQPYVVPIYFSYDGEYVYGFSTPGQKIEWMRANPLVCLEIDEATGIEEWYSIVVTGRYEELTDTPEFAPDRARAHEALQLHARWWQYTAVAGAEWRRKSIPFRPIFYRIQITHLSGHRSVRSESAV